MLTLITWTCMILGLWVCGLVVSDALSWERWVNFSWVAAQPALAQEIRHATSPVRRSRFARPVPRGWAAPSLAGARDRPDEPWRLRLAQLGLPVPAQERRLWVESAGTTVLSMGRDAVARHGAPPLASSVGRVFAGSALGAPFPVQTVGSPKKWACETEAIPLPKVRLVKDVLDAMPDKCDERLFDTWYCGIYCIYDDCEANDAYTIRQSIDPDGYERIRRDSIIGTPYYSEYRVERKWGASVSNYPLEQGKLVATGCNAKTDAGYSNLSVNFKNPDGTGRELTKYSVDGANRTLWIEYYNVRWVGDKPHNTLTGRSECKRELAP